MRALIASLVFLLIAHAAVAQTYLAAVDASGNPTRLAVLDASNATAPQDGSCPSCQVVTAQQYAAYAAELTAPPPTSPNVAIACASNATICTSAIAGTYAYDAADMGKAAVIAGELAANVIPGGGPTFNYADAFGTMHTFTPQQFLEAYQAVVNYDYELSQGQTPATPLTIP